MTMSRDLDTTAPAAAESVSRSIDIVELLVSPAFRYVGRPSDGADPTPPGDLVEELQIRAGLGVVGDRYFNKPAHRRGAITLQSAEGLEEAARILRDAGHPVEPIGLAQTRRNVLVRGVDLEELIGHDVEIDGGDGPIGIRVHRPAPGCAWMNVAIAPGAHAALRKRGGVRAEPLTDGTLRVGPATLTVRERVREREQNSGRSA